MAPLSNSATLDEIEAGRGYEKLFVPALFSPWTRHVITAALPMQGADVHDVVCGTGVLIRAARAHAGSSARVVGIDPAPDMLAVAQEIEAKIN